MNNITLTSSMRSNLSSLKSLASQMSTTQTRLSTGKKVTKAIDNASSYYQARALTNRASDLDMLLDSMGQSIQTIQSAVHGLEKSSEVLENAAVIAQEAYEAEKTISVPATKEYFAELVGENGAVVSTAQELKDAIAANKETICVYGKIDYFENETLTMRAGQKLVGTEYFTGYTGNKKFSEINFSGTQEKAIYAASNCLISDLSLNFDSHDFVSSSNLIYTSHYSTNLRLNNLDLSHISGTQGSSQGAIHVDNYSSAILSGTINLNGNGKYGNGVVVWDNSYLVLEESAVLNVKSQGRVCGSAFDIIGKSTVDIYGKLNIESSNRPLWLESGTFSGSTLNLHNTAEVTILGNYWAVGSRKDETTYNVVNIENGAKLNLNDSGVITSLISQGYSLGNNTTSGKSISSSTLIDSGSFTEIANTVDWDSWSAIPQRGNAQIPTKEVYDREQFDAMMSAYDDMVSDSSYQGVNLIKGGNMSVMFNESRTHSYVVSGKDMSANSIGITDREWSTKQDILDSINEIKNAMNSIRDEVARLGNNLSIIETRMNFTDAMTDILQIGADDLILADMNEESANYLALQTRNNLAVNALSLAAQSNNAVLKLF